MFHLLTPFFCEKWKKEHKCFIYFYLNFNLVPHFGHLIVDDDLLVANAMTPAATNAKGNVPDMAEPNIAIPAELPIQAPMPPALPIARTFFSILPLAAFLFLIFLIRVPHLGHFISSMIAIFSFSPGFIICLLFVNCSNYEWKRCPILNLLCTRSRYICTRTFPLCTRAWYICTERFPLCTRTFPLCTQSFPLCTRNEYICTR